ncbi:hypothetical protein, partial [Klebsiella pneumoniae]|uniref:hypothetical protein n=1 Tax=Klebsiella pneumoniae TaxID=573 RepID=UPI0019535CF6
VLTRGGGSCRSRSLLVACGRSPGGVDFRSAPAKAAGVCAARDALRLARLHPAAGIRAGCGMT